MLMCVYVITLQKRYNQESVNVSVFLPCEAQLQVPDYVDNPCSQAL